MHVTDKIDDYIDQYQIVNSITNWDVIDYFDRQDEAFNNPSNIKVTQSTNDMFSCAFVINDVKYIVICKINKQLAIVLFHPLDGDDDLFKERNNPYYVGRIFASLFQSIKELLNRYPHITKIGFNAETTNLDRLYNTMMPYILKRFPEWKNIKQIKNKQYMFVRK